MIAKKILVLGSAGQVSEALMEVKPSDFSKVIQKGLPEVDFLNPMAVLNVLNAEAPNIVINAVAYTGVDKAESQKDICRQINATTVGLIADWCKTHSVLLVHYSTDYVFDGSGNKARSEADPTGPLNFYGQTKLEGEQLVQASGCRHVILRTSWVYYHQGSNFVKTMLRLAGEKEELSIVCDQVGAPTYAGDIAVATYEILRKYGQGKFAEGLYHFCNQGETNWYDFASEIFALADAGKQTYQAKQAQQLKQEIIEIPNHKVLKKINKIYTIDYKTPAPRPLNSRLSLEKLHATGIQLPHWQTSLKVCLEKI